MIFCEECFYDTEIRARISAAGKRGSCPICGANNGFIYDTEEEDYLRGIFDRIISIYTPKNALPDEFPISKHTLIKHELLTNWRIFNDLNSEQVYDIITTLSSELYDNSPELFDDPVANIQIRDPIYLRENSILRDNTWKAFVESLKHDNRFHTDYTNTEKLETYCSYIRKVYKQGSVFYRGRVSSIDGYRCDEMGAPPLGLTLDGRANSAGIRRLYLANNVETTIHEVRAGAVDYITVGKFELIKDTITIVDFKMIDKISPFIEELDPLQYFVNREPLNRINDEMGKTLRRSDSPLDYLPTQYVTDFIKSIQYEGTQEYAGIEYKSTMNPGGYNLAVFDPELFECTQTQVYKIDKLVYEKSLV